MHSYGKIADTSRMNATTIEVENTTLEAVRELCRAHGMTRKPFMAAMVAHFAAMTPEQRAIALLAKPTTAPTVPAPKPRRQRQAAV